jgi:alanine dehydrogenase
MIIGVPKEIKDNEYRVSLTPGGAHMLVEAGHRVLVETGAGEGSGFSDAEYERVGATLVGSPSEVFNGAEMVLKVKEPLPQEYDFLRPGLLLFTYLHLAACEELTHELLRREVTGIAYETVELPNGYLPLLTPMSEVAGRMAGSARCAALRCGYHRRWDGGHQCRTDCPGDGGSRDHR